MKIKWKIGVSGTVHNREGGVKVGDVMDLEDAEGERYIRLGYAEAVKPGGKLSEEHAVAAFSNEERAILDTEIVGATNKPIPQSKVAQARHDDPEPIVLTADPEPEAEVEKVEAEKPKPRPAPRRTSK